MYSLLLIVVLLGTSASGDFSQSGPSGSTMDGSDSSDSSFSASPQTPAPEPAKPMCVEETTGDNQRVDLSAYGVQGPVTVLTNATTSGSSDVYLVSPCTLSTMTNCTWGTTGHRSGYVTKIVDGACEVVYNTVKAPAAWDASSQSFSIVYETPASTLTVVLMCDPEADGTTGNVTGDFTASTLTIGSYKMCPGSMLPTIPMLDLQCSVDFTKYGRTFEASLDQFDAATNKTLTTGAAVVITPCAPQSFVGVDDRLTGCPETKGYMAYMSGGACIVLDDKVATYNPNDLSFNTTFFSRASSTAAPTMFGASTTKNRQVVIIQCGATDSTDGVAKNNAIVYTSTEVCGTETAVTKSPKAAQDDPLGVGLSTLAIVLICAGALLAVILLVVLIKCVCARTAAGEGEYTRVYDRRKGDRPFTMSQP